MPKEFIHFSIAQRTAGLLAGTDLGRAAERFDASLLLGSVFHDAWYYLTGRRPGRLREVADELHGKDGQDTFWILTRQAESAREAQLSGDETRAGTAASLLVGMASHIFADVTMHPMVYHFSGNYFADRLAVERHRRLESLLDMAADRLERDFDKNPRISSMLRTVRLAGAYPRDALAELAEVSPETLSSELHDAFQVFATVQRHVQKSNQGRLAWWLRPLMPRSMRDFAALFYAPQLKKHLPLVMGELNYLHPVTGEQRTATLAGLMDEAAAGAADLLRGLEPFVLGQGELVLPGPGPSLDTGLPGCPVEQAVHFALQPIPPM